MAEDEKLTLTFAATGVTAGMNLVESRCDAFTKAGCLRYAQLRKMRPGAKVKVGGLVADGVRRPPTAKGTAFMRLVIWTNDVRPESFEMGDVVIPPQVYVACRDALHSSAFFIVEGKLERLTPTLQVLATKVSSLP